MCNHRWHVWKKHNSPIKGNIFLALIAISLFIGNVCLYHTQYWNDNPHSELCGALFALILLCLITTLVGLLHHSMPENELIWLFPSCDKTCLKCGKLVLEATKCEQKLEKKREKQLLEDVATNKLIDQAKIDYSKKLKLLNKAK